MGLRDALLIWGHGELEQHRRFDGPQREPCLVALGQRRGFAAY
jgi:hypothetical protein